MKRYRIWLSFVCFLPVLLIISAGAPATGGPPAGSAWAMKGTWTDSCCCKVSCPCLFGTKPTEGFCQGASLLEITSGHFGDVKLDGTTAVVAYHVGDWTRVYVDDAASDAQVKALAELVPKALPLYGKGEMASVEKTAVSVERGEGTVKYSVDTTTVELALVPGADGKPIVLQNLPAKGTPFPVVHDHTQYKSVKLEHAHGDGKFTWSGRNGFVSKVDISGS